MKRFMAIIFSLFLVSLFGCSYQPAEEPATYTSEDSHRWKQCEIPSYATHTVQAFENVECKVVERNFPEMGFHDIFIVFKDDRFAVQFEYSEVIMLIIKTDDYFTRSDVFALINMYGALNTGIYDGEI